MNYLEYFKSFSKKDITFLTNESLKEHCSFNIGGIAKYFVIIHNKKTLLKLTKDVDKYFILGAGTNILFKKKEYVIPIFKLGKDFNKIEIKKEDKDNVLLEVGASTNLFSLNNFLRKNEIGGLEWSYGIPGSVGGATLMNAGAYEQEFDKYVNSVKILENNKIFRTKAFSFSYRESSFKNTNQIILGVRLSLIKKSSKKIEEEQNFFINKRKKSQPYGQNSAGSVFKRIINKTEIFYPAKIIDNLGLKGVKIGGAEISQKHAGFIVNYNNAQAKDVLKLIKLIKSKVKKETKTLLEEEIIIY